MNNSGSKDVGLPFKLSRQKLVPPCNDFFFIFFFNRTRRRSFITRSYYHVHFPCRASRELPHPPAPSSSVNQRPPVASPARESRSTQMSAEKIDPTLSGVDVHAREPSLRSR